MTLSAEERGLVASVVAAPDDDTPRLIYADWLDENDRGEQAEYIRLAIERDRIHPARANLGNPRFAALSVRLDELSEQHGSEAVLRRAGVHPDRSTSCVFRRGFIEELWCPAKWFAKEAAPLFDVIPVTTVGLCRMSLGGLSPLRSALHFARVRSLAMRRNELTEDLLLSLLESVPVAHLRSLSVRQFSFRAQPGGTHDQFAWLAARIARTPDFDGLERLDLDYCCVGDAGGLALAESHYLRRIKHLDLRHNPMSGFVIDRLRERFGERVQL